MTFLVSLLMNTTRMQIDLDMAVCISFKTYTLGKKHESVTSKLSHNGLYLLLPLTRQDLAQGQ